MNFMRIVKDYFIPHENNNFKPHFFREEAIIFVMLVLVVLFASSVGSTTILRTNTLLGDVYASVLVDLTNEDRVANQEAPLILNSILASAAELKATDMVSKGYFAHTSPEGITPWHWFAQAGYSFIYAGENLAVGFDESDAVNQGWLDSPGHKANILSEKFTEIGIAAVPGIYKGKPTTYVVQLFGKPKVAPATVVAPPVVAPIIPTALVVPTETKVLGAEVENVPAVVIVAEEENMIVAQSFETPDPVPAPERVVPHYSTWYERLLVSQPYRVQTTFTLVSIVVIVALILYIFIEIRIQHKKNLIYGFGLLAFVVLLMIVNHSLIVIPTIVS